jgi:hypothetical protein
MKHLGRLSGPGIKVRGNTGIKVAGSDIMGSVSAHGMPALPASSLPGVTHVPGLICYLCTRSLPGVNGRGHS